MKTKIAVLVSVIALAVGVTVYAAQTNPPGAPVPGTWYRSSSISMGAPFFLTDISTALTAKASGSQTSATALTSAVSEVTTVASGNDALILPKIQSNVTKQSPGMAMVITNSAASNTAKLYAVNPATINGIATATGYSLAAGKSCLCIAVSTTNWACVGP